MTIRDKMEEILPIPDETARPDASPASVSPADLPAHSAPAPLENRVASLASALRRARVENAEHSSARVDVRAAEIARLEMLAEALAPVLVQAPEDCDIFDIAIAPGATPRLFIDQIGFVEMDRDRRTYRFLQDTRHGRITLIESDEIEALVDSITDYIAHRLIEREKALAIDYASGGGVKALRQDSARPKTHSSRLSPQQRAALTSYLFFVEIFGATAFFGLVAAIGYWVYRTNLAG